MLIACEPTERSFSGQVYNALYIDRAHWAARKANAVAAILHALEGLCEKIVFDAYRLDHDDIVAVLDETGTPAGWFPLITGYDEIPALPTSLPVLPQEMLEFIQKHDRRALSPQQLAGLKVRLRALYEAGPGAKEETEDIANAQQEDGEEEVAVGARIPIPAETFIEELSQKLEVHPVSIYWLLREGIEEEGWRCLPEERRLTAHRFTVLILRLLGHRWPKEIEASEQVPDWADHDGIIPLKEGTDELTLLDRVRRRIPEEFEGGDVTFIEREFTEVMGKSLDQWLATDFFCHHTKQFKKHPIAWQIQSSRFTARRRPAFACLVYYHKLSGTTLATIQSQYVRPLRQRYETELRGIESVPQAECSEQQESRRKELLELIEELRQFDDALDRVATEGFAGEVDDIVKKEPLDRWFSIDGVRPHPDSLEGLSRQERSYLPDLNDGVRVNIAPLQKAGLLAADVLAKSDVEKAIVDRALWRADERRWCREAKLPQPGWWYGETIQ